MSIKGLLAKIVGISSDGRNVSVSGSLTASGGVDEPIGQGNIYYLDPTNGSDSYLGKTPGTAFATLEHAYDQLTANQNDVLKYLSGASEATIAEGVTWAKSYTHLIGVCAPVPIAQRARVMVSANMNTMLTISASGCIFANQYWFQGSTAAANVNNVVVTGFRNYFYNFHFAGIGHATPAGQATANSLKLNAAAECMFERCTIGVDTIKRTADNHQLIITGDTKRNQFKDCMFLSFADTDTYALIEVAGGQDRWTLFDRCLFYNFSTNHAVNLLELCDYTLTTTHDTIFKDCTLVGILEYDADDTTGTWIDGAAPTADTSGVAIKPVLS